MYIFIGQERVLRSGGIIGVFDLDNISQSKRTRAFLSAAERAGRVSMVGTDLPRSVVLYDGLGKTEVILTQIAAGTIEKRARGGF